MVDAVSETRIETGDYHAEQRMGNTSIREYENVQD